jgi:glycosyltransferase involved in cell wall biosynthesis
VVFSKLLRDPDGSFGEAARRYRELLARTPQAESRVVLDVNDDNFAVPVFRSFYVEAGKRIRQWICSTEPMREALLKYASGAVSVVPDPYEGPEGEPKAPPRNRFPRLGRALRRMLGRAAAAEPLRVLWFGHNSNTGTFADAIPQLKRIASLHAVELTCVSAAGMGLERICKESADAAGGFSVRFVPWTVDSVWRGLAECDLVVLPSESQNRRMLVKSANRLIETIRAGRLAVAHPLPSYQPLGGYAWLGEDLARGVEWALAHPAEARRRIGAGQRFVAAHFSPEAVARQWLSALSPGPA